ncbi:MAG: methyltransferase domain-containing protein [Candidatus Woesearchaeota archaeon]|nr:methyltransferase domain-containing protein [Candidatus Woesearchaeota archaeon]
MIRKILITKEGKKFYVGDTGRDFHTQFGFIRKSDLKSSGKLVKTNKGEQMRILDPSFIDLFRKIKRHAQIITPKDIGMIISNTGVNKKSYVVEFGSGSGALTCFLGHIAKKVSTYDIDDRSLEATRENVKLLKLKNVDVNKADCYAKTEETKDKNADLVAIDLPDPWKALDNAVRAAKTGGFIISNEARKKGLLVLRTIELIEREWVLDKDRARPDFRGLGHTGFLTFARKLE